MKIISARDCRPEYNSVYYQIQTFNPIDWIIMDSSNSFTYVRVDSYTLTDNTICIEGVMRNGKKFSYKESGGNWAGGPDVEGERKWFAKRLIQAIEKFEKKSIEKTEETDASRKALFWHIDNSTMNMRNKANLDRTRAKIKPLLSESYKNEIHQSDKKEEENK